jgi:hypothetical protein
MVRRVQIVDDRNFKGISTLVHDEGDYPMEQTITLVFEDLIKKGKTFYIKLEDTEDNLCDDNHATDREEITREGVY